jgi:hypothetical protein
MVVVAQLVRALVCGAGSRGFESHLPPFKMKADSNESAFLYPIKKSKKRAIH